MWRALPGETEVLGVEPSPPSLNMDPTPPVWCLSRNRAGGIPPSGVGKVKDDGTENEGL
jgi:hypothetical protein